MSDKSFTAGLLSAGFSASTGLKICSPAAVTAGEGEPVGGIVRGIAGLKICSPAAVTAGKGEPAGGILRGIAGLKVCSPAAVTAGKGEPAGGRVREIADWFDSLVYPLAPSPLGAVEPTAVMVVTTGSVGGPAMAASSAVLSFDLNKEVTVTLGIKELISLNAMTYLMSPDPKYEGGGDDSFNVRVHLLKRDIILTVNVKPSWKVEKLRTQVASKLGLTRQQLIVIFNGAHLEDYEQIHSLGINSHSIIYALKCLPGQRVGIFMLDPSALEPRYDFDLTGQSDDGETYRRGGHDYARPYGWNRHAVKVRGEYEDDTWLGEDGIRTESTPGEWAVAYHGTDRSAIDPILEDGYRVGHRELYGKAVYTSPALEKVAENYGTKFSYEGKRYQFVLQNRVDPDHLTVIPPDSCCGRKDFPYWLSTEQDPEKGVFHVRPYGILTREV